MAARIQKKIFEEIRDKLGWFPTWPIGANAELGKVGFFHGRNKEFEWVTSLEDLSIDLQPAGSQRVFDEMYATEAAVSCKFRVDPQANKRFADFSFGRRNSIAAQGYDMAFLELPINRLNELLVERISRGQLKWDYRWVILTQVFNATGYSALMAGSKNSSMSLAANIEAGVSSFNIANINLEIEAESHTNMAFQTLCKHGASPYFYVHKLIRNGDRPYLRRYANRTPLFYV
jgi:hypothetical protein